MQEGTIFLVVLCCGNYSSDQYKVYFSYPLRGRCTVRASIGKRHSCLRSDLRTVLATVPFYVSVFFLRMQKKKL